MINTSMYDPMDLFTCEKCQVRGDRDMSYKVDKKLVCSDCAKELLNNNVLKTNSNS